MILVSCEHAGNEVPTAYQPYFESAKEVLQSHKGWDPGALDIATFLSQQLNAPLFSTKVSRLVVEVNRSLHSPQLFSEFVAQLSEDDKQQILQDYWHCYRDQVERAIESIVSLRKSVIHLSIHSFTPFWEGKERAVELGMLYDPDRQSELQWCGRFHEKLTAEMSGLLIRHNEPYAGKDDGFTSYLRTQFTDEQYLGVELEINQKFVGNRLKHISSTLLNALLAMKE